MSRARLTSYLLLAVLVLGSGLGVGLGLSEAPPSQASAPKIAISDSETTTTLLSPPTTSTTLPGTGPLPRCKALAGGSPDFRIQLANKAAQTFIEQRRVSPFLCFMLSVPNPTAYPELMQCDGATGREGSVAVLTLSSGQPVDLTTMYDYTLKQLGEPCYLFHQ